MDKLTFLSYEEARKSGEFNMIMDAYLVMQQFGITKEDYYEHSFLPLKFGAVSMAKKTSSQIVPYIITGQYKFRSKDLKIIIGKPLDPQDDLEKANYALRETFKKLLKQSLENNEK